MKILGNKGLGNILKILLEILFVIGILILLVFPLVISNTNISINPNIIIFYPNAICLLLIMYQFIGLFNSLKISNPFCENTVKRLKSAGKVSSVASIFWLLDFIYEAIIVKNEEILWIIVLIFMTILFIGVSIALFILSELFKSALEYKKENDLTI